MANIKFNVEKIRFHLTDEDIIVVQGWYFDNSENEWSVQACLDAQDLSIDVTRKTGLEVRQKYLVKGVSVSEEVFLWIRLPKNWNHYHKFILYCANGTERYQIQQLTTVKLKQMQKEINYYFDQVKYADRTCDLVGWMISEYPIEVEARDSNGRNLDIEIECNFRKDVEYVYPELQKEIKAGVKIQIPMKNPESCVICLQSGDKRSTYKVNKRQIEHNSMSNRVTFMMLMKKTIASLRRYGIQTTMQKIKKRLFKNRTLGYDTWVKKHHLSEKELNDQRQKSLSFSPRFSIVVPLYKTPKQFLEAMVQSVMDQTYGNWELCLADGSAEDGEDSPIEKMLSAYQNKDSRIQIKVLDRNLGIAENTNAAIAMASGEFIVFADHDDLIAPNALYECVKQLNQDETVEILYSDEDKISIEGKRRFEPNFKPDFDIDLLCSMNYICHLFVVKKTLLDQVGGLQSEYNGAQDYDLIFRCCEQAEKIVHIPKILYHWRCHSDSTASNPESKRYAFEAGKNAIEAHYKRMEVPATVEHSAFYGMYRTHYHWEEKPLISIIIPNKDHTGDLDKCISSIEERSTYRNYEFIIVENNSTQPETFKYYEELQNRLENVHVVSYNGDFNFSKINNFGVESAKGEYLLLLNNDTEIINNDCIEELLDYCMRDDVGIVGARLYYEDDTIQHAGVVIGFGGIAGHTFIGMSRYDIGYQGRIICAQDYSAVTAACMMTKRSVFQQVGGLTETLEVAFNDIDYCMKVRKLGKLVVYNPYAELYHYESKSRGLEDTPEKVERFNKEVKLFQEQWPELLEKGDPYYNPNLTLDKADFSLKYYD